MLTSDFFNKPTTEEKTRLDPKCWTGKKIGDPKTKMKGGVRVNNCVPVEEETENNPIDTVKMDVPLLIRALEYAREDVKNDVELHKVVERMIAAAQAGEALNMDDYNMIFGDSESEHEQDMAEELAYEPDEKGLQHSRLTMPQNTLVIDTPGDLDWYKLGHDIANLNQADPHEYGQSDSDVVITTASPEEMQKLMKQLDRLGLRYKLIGGTDDQPEIHDEKFESVAEATGDKPFDSMMKNISTGTAKQKTADRKEQRKQTQQQARDAFGNMFGGGNPADKLKIKEQGVAEASLGNVLPWPEVANKISSAMKAMGWKGQRKGDDSYLFSTKGAEDESQYYMVMIDNEGNGMFTYALGTFEGGRPDIGEQGTLPTTAASVSEVLMAIRDGYGLNEQGVAEGSEWETRHNEFVTVGDKATPEQINKIVKALVGAAQQAGSKRGVVNRIFGKQSNDDLARMAHGAETLAKNIQKNSNAKPGTDERKELGQHLVYAVSLLKRISGEQGVAEGQFDLINDDDFYEYNVDSKEIVARTSVKAPTARALTPNKSMEWPGRDDKHKITKGFKAKSLKRPN